jgi:hypothetical protein
MGAAGVPDWAQDDYEPWTVTDIATCLGVPEGRVTINGQRGADEVGGYLEQEYMGITFTVAGEGGAADNNYEYSIGLTPWAQNDTYAPTITIDPADSATNVAEGSNMTLTANEAVRLLDDAALTDANVDALITLKDTNANGENIPFDATVSGNVITINPTSDFSSLQQVYVRIGASIEDTSGNAISETSATFTTADTVAPTVTLTGPSEIVTGAFDVSAVFSEAVTDLIITEISVVGGTVSGLTGNNASYTITIDPNLGATVTVFISAGAARDGAGNDNIVSNTYTIQAGSPASAFEEYEEEILEVVTDEALRGVRATVSSNLRMTRAARERFISGRQQAGVDSQIVSRAATPLDITGSAELGNGSLSTQGTFFGQTGSGGGGQTRLFFGDFDVQRDDDGSVSAQFNAKLAWERQISTTVMYGYYLGAELGRATLEGGFAGDQDSFGASVGAYFVAEVQPNLYIDGFASLGLGRNALELDNGILNVVSDYTTTTGTVGASLTAVVEGDGYEFWPQLQLTYGQTHIGMMTFTGAAYSLVDDTLSMDAGSVSMASAAFTAEFKVPLDGRSVLDSNALFTFAPRLICEQTMAAYTTNDCGGGVEVGIESRSNDGLSNLSVSIRSDRVGNTTSTGLGLNFERTF